ncbi:MAG: DNA topoisomerase [Muribaculum sp.]|nr:DNA topoisomerase [Muribaculum sp.]
MITIIAQNQRVALIIARAIEADDEASRYYYNDKYYVTWMTGKMVEITTPRGLASYWFRNASFPHIPQYFTLSITTKTRKDGTSLTEEAAAQVATIRMLIKKSESVISAMEPNAEGELKFRYLQAYLGFSIPVRRAVINELTNGTIRYAVTHPINPEGFGARYKAARLRDEADWLVNVNARRAVAFAAGRGTYQIGRTSASVLRMIAERNIAVASQAGQKKLHYATIAIKDSDGNIFPMRSVEPVTTTSTSGSPVKILSCEVHERKLKTPKLYNLAALQLDAAKEFDMSPLSSYEAAIRLYEYR